MEIKKESKPIYLLDNVLSPIIAYTLTLAVCYFLVSLSHFFDRL